MRRVRLGLWTVGLLHFVGGTASVVLAGTLGCGDWLVLLLGVAGLTRVVAAAALVLDRPWAARACGFFSIAGLGFWTLATGGLGLLLAGPWHGYCLRQMTTIGRLNGWAGRAGQRQVVAF